MMRHRARIDGDQGGIHNQIVAALRGCGCSVLSLAGLGRGAPDALVGVPRIRSKIRTTPGWLHNVNILMEFKDGSKPPSRRKLTKDEQAFFDAWRGQVCKVESVEQALRAVGIES